MCVRVRYSDIQTADLEPHAYYDADDMVVYVSETATLGQALTLVRRVMTNLGVKQHPLGCTCFCGDCVLLTEWYATVSV
ncbi:hypothetical protein ACFRCG_47930 [Embleya sp. NPDC056575]|uniref:hypothetical protein n=1 Tax=unclassified Embleya TaxID=2699296 RepID=UPI0036A690DD